MEASATVLASPEVIVNQAVRRGFLPAERASRESEEGRVPGHEEVRHFIESWYDKECRRVALLNDAESSKVLDSR